MRLARGARARPRRRASPPSPARSSSLRARPRSRSTVDAARERPASHRLDRVRSRPGREPRARRPPGVRRRHRGLVLHLQGERATDPRHQRGHRARSTRHQVVPMRADWTNQNEEIARFLADFGRYSIPVLSALPPGRGAASLPRAPDQARRAPRARRERRSAGQSLALTRRFAWRAASCATRRAAAPAGAARPRSRARSGW